jgi:hypothetical protein
MSFPNSRRSRDDDAAQAILFQVTALTVAWPVGARQNSQEAAHVTPSRQRVKWWDAFDLPMLVSTSA